MLSQCLNPSCGAPFRYMYEGRVFAVERSTMTADGVRAERTIAHYWLCGPCSRTMKVVVENGVATAVPMHVELMTQAPAKEKSLPPG
jgi:hypothetical protein